MSESSNRADRVDQSELARLLSGGDVYASLNEKELRKLVLLLEYELQAVKDELVRFETLQKDTAQGFDEFVREFAIDSALTGTQLTGSLSGNAIEKTCQLLAETVSQISGLRSSCSTIAVLCGRLETTISFPQIRDSNLKAYASELEATLEVYQQDLDRLAKRDEEALAILQLFLDTPEFERPQLIASLNCDDLGTLLSVIIGRQISLETKERLLLHLRGQYSLAGMLLGLINKEYSLDNILRIDEAIRHAVGDRQKLYELLSHLEFVHLQRLLEDFPEHRNLVLEFTLATAVRTQDSDRLALLRPLIPSSLSSRPANPVEELFEMLVTMAEESPGERIFEVIRERQSSVERPVHAVDELVMFIDRPAPPGGGGWFHALREVARKLFLQPLKSDILAERWHAVSRMWTEFGTLEQKLAACSGSFTKRDQKRIESRHHEKTIEYLAEFEQKLLRILSAPVHDQRFATLLEQVRAVNGLPSSDAFPKRISELLLADASDAGVLWPPKDFGNRVAEGILSDDCVAGLDASLLNSWIAKCSNKPVTLTMRVADELSGTLENRSRTATNDTITSLCQNGHFAAAEKAAKDNPPLEGQFAEIVESKRRELEPAWLADARTSANASEELGFYLEDYDKALADFNFAYASEILPLIKAQFERSRLVADPKTRRFVLFLEQLDLPPPSALNEMETLVESQKAAAAPRRFHIEQLFADAARFPESFRKEFNDVAIEIDMPSFWARSPEESFELAVLIEYYGRFISSKLESGRAQFATSLARWFVSELKKSVEDNHRLNIENLVTLKKGRDDSFWEDETILRFIEPVLASLPVEAEGTREVTVQLLQKEPDAGIPVLKVTADETPSVLPAILVELRRQISAIRESGVSSSATACSDSEIRQLCAKGKWREVVAQLRLHQELNDPPIGQLTEEEGLLVVAEASRQLAEGAISDGLWLQACLGVCSQLVSQTFYLDKGSLQDRAVALLVSVWRHPELKHEKRKEAAASMLEHLSSCPSGDRTSQKLVELFRKARFFQHPEEDSQRGDLILASSLWEELRGMPNVKVPRSHLIDFLYQREEFDLLRALARKYAFDLSEGIVQCLEAFHRGSSNSEALDEAVQLATIVNEHATGEKVAPWTRVIDSLLSRRKEDLESELLKVLDESITATHEHIVVNTSLIPSRNDWPRSLNVKVWNEDDVEVYCAELLGGKALVRPQTVCIRIPLHHASVKGGFVRLRYEITANSNRVDGIAIRGAWSWKEDRLVDQFTTRELRQYWPGADGSDVKTREHYHGRKEAWDKISMALAASNGYQKSLLIIGQRRIGKTSLLNQVLNSYPPGPGRCCGIYANISGLKPEAASLRQALFDQILVQLETAPGDKNREILEVFTQHGRELRRVVRDVDPSLSIAGALEMLARVLGQVTDGQMARIAFCLDEFQAVFSWRDPEEVKALMWDLRQIVQSSKSVSLLMAGSGLTRRLTESYDEALFGSIETIELEPFSLERESEAISSTFLPTQVRKIFQEDNDRKKLVKAAHEATGGHPWYLAILGSAMATVFGKTTVSSAMLSVVIEQLVNGQVNSEWQPKTFYGHLFESLNVLGPRQTAVAQLVLLIIAKNTTTDWRDWSEARLRENGLLVGRIEKTEVSAALKTLEQEKVIIKLGSGASRKYRITVPLVAEALKRDADEKLDEALNMLET